MERGEINGEDSDAFFLDLKSANVEALRARSASGCRDPLAAVDGRAAVIAVMAGDVVKIAGLSQRLGVSAIAGDDGCLA
jgi:hypothetical protein